MPKREDLLLDSEFFSKNQSYVLILCNVHNFCNLLYVQTIGRRIMFEWVIISWNPAKVVSFFCRPFLQEVNKKRVCFHASVHSALSHFCIFCGNETEKKRRRKQNKKNNVIAFTLQEWRGNLLNGSCIPWMLRWLRNFL